MEPNNGTKLMFNITNALIYSCIYLFFYSMFSIVVFREDEIMSDVLVVGLITAGTSLIIGIISAIVTYRIAKKSQIDANTKAITELKDELISHYASISEDIGRNDNASLSKQHSQMTESIKESYKSIEARYDKQDEAYRRFTTEQYDLKQTLDNFARNYTEVINNEHKLYMENCELKEANNLLQKDIEKLKKQNKQLINELSQEQVEEEIER